MQGCYVQNKGGVIICPACQTPKPGHEAEAAKSAVEKEDPFKSGNLFASGAVVTPPTSGAATFSFGAANKGQKLFHFFFVLFCFVQTARDLRMGNSLGEF